MVNIDPRTYNFIGIKLAQFSRGYLCSYLYQNIKRMCPIICDFYLVSVQKQILNNHNYLTNITPMFTILMVKKNSS
jgi:hypothetical protein